MIKLYHLQKWDCKSICSLLAQGCCLEVLELWGKADQCQDRDVKGRQ